MKKLLFILTVILTTGSFVSAQAPVINSFSPTTGFVGSTVTITGANFDGSSPANNQVFFGSAQATVLTASFGTLTVTVPAGSTTSLISVRNATTKLTGYSRNHFNGIFCDTPLDSTTYAPFNTSGGDQQLSGVYGAYNIDIYDMDGDGKSDIITGKNDGGLTIARNNSTVGNMNFVATNINTNTPTTAYVQQFFVADFDGNGKRDILISGAYGAFLFPNLSTPGTISFGARVTITTTGFYQCAAGDFDNDGKIDLVGGNGNYVTTYRNTSSGPGNFNFVLNTSVDVGSGSNGIQCVDLDGDGKSDIVATQRSANRIYALRNTTSTATFTFNATQYFSTVNAGPYRLKIGDFDKDGKIDLVMPLYEGAKTCIFRNTSSIGTINFSTPLLLAASANNYRVGVGDVNGDGFPDVVTKPNGIGTLFQVYQNTSSGAGSISFNAAITYYSSAGAEVGGIAIGDMDGDLVPDIATSGISSNVIRFHRNKSSQADNQPPSAICKNITVALSPTGTATVTGAMIDNGSGDACGLAPFLINGASSVTYTCENIGINNVTLTVSDLANNKTTCTAIVTVAPAAIIITGQTTVCQGGSIPMTANLGDSYQWKKDGVDIAGATSQQYSATVTGNYSVAVVNSGGCSGISAPVTATINANPTVSTTPSGIVYFCGSNNSVLLSASPSSLYQWKLNGVNIAGVTQKDYLATSIGTYSVEVVDLFGCSAVSNPITTSLDNIAPVAVAQNLTVQLNAAGSVTITPQQINNGSSDACGIASMSLDKSNFTCADFGQNTVTLTVTDIGGNSATATAIVTVSGADNDGDGVPDICDLDDDNDGILDISECTTSNFHWSSPPALSGKTATGTINGIGYTYTSSVNVSSTPSIYNHGIFPSQYNVPNANPTIQNIDPSQNTLSFASPMTNPVLVFSSIGNSGLPVTINFSNPVQILWSTATVQNSPTQITGNEGYTIVRMNGTFTSISFDYLTYENWVNFVFGADFYTYCDTDNDGLQDYLDTDSDGDGCIDAIEGSLGLTPDKTLNGMLTGGVDQNGVPLLAGQGQGVGTSNVNSASCMCDLGLDETAPVVVTKNITVQLDESGTATIVPTDIDNGSNDECGIESLVLDLSSFNCSKVGANTVNLTATDVHGNVSSATATVTVVDDILPTVLTQNQTIYLDANGKASVTVPMIDNASFDNCAVATLVLDKMDFDCSNIGANTVTLTVTDVNGNVNTATATVTVVDNILPTVLTQNQTIYLDANGKASVTVPMIDNASFDNCAFATLVLDKMDFDCSNIGANTVTLTVTDVNGNVNAATATVTVVDNILPTVLTQNQTIYLDANGKATVTVPMIDNASFDNCAVATLALDKVDFGCSNVGTNTVILTVTDVNGNVNTATATVTVVDNILPTVLTQNQTIYLDVNGKASVTVPMIDNASFDNCAVATLVLDKVDFDCSNIGANIVTLKATDVNGNVNTAAATVTVVDNTLPTVLTQNKTINLDANGKASVTVSMIDNASFDNCAVATLVLDKMDFDCSNVGANKVTLTVTDVNGNVSTATAVVTVQDKIAPALIVPGNIVKLNDAGVCGAVVNIGQATATDNCSVASITSNAPSFFPVGTTTVTWTAVDASGNTTTGTQTVVITNNVPVISGLTVTPLIKFGTPIIASATHADNNLVAATWNWGDGLSTPANISGSQISGNHVYGQAGLYNVTLSIEDACGKSDTKTYSYVVIYNSCNGFVTGGGYFTTPPGSYTANKSIKGKSNYGFEAKYEKDGDKVPKGEFNFHLNEAKFKVKSTKLEWLMVNNDMAIIKGIAKVNEKDGYHFIASMVDGKVTSPNGKDYLRVIVWDNTGNILYDNQDGESDASRASTPTRGGQIVIHKYRKGKCFGDDYDKEDEHDTHCDMDDDKYDDSPKDDHDKYDNSPKDDHDNKNGSNTPILLEMSVYPNPLVNTHVVDVDVKNFGNTIAKVELSYINGRVVLSIPKVEFSNGKAKIDLRQANLKTGNYLMTVSEKGSFRVGVKQIIVF